MTIGTIKKIEKTERGAWSIVMEDKTSMLNFDRSGILSSFHQGDKIEYEAERKTSQTGRDYWVMKNPRRPTDSNMPTSVGAIVNAANNHRGGMNNDWQIFVTGVVGRAMGSGKFGLTDIRGLTLAALEAWYDLSEQKAHLDKPSPKPASPDEDFIPF